MIQGQRLKTQQASRVARRQKTLCRSMAIYCQETQELQAETQHSSNKKQVHVGGAAMCLVFRVVSSGKKGKRLGPD